MRISGIRVGSSEIFTLSSRRFHAPFMGRVYSLWFNWGTSEAIAPSAQGDTHMSKRTIWKPEHGTGPAPREQSDAWRGTMRSYRGAPLIWRGAGWYTTGPTGKTMRRVMEMSEMETIGATGKLLRYLEYGDTEEAI